MTRSTFNNIRTEYGNKYCKEDKKADKSMAITFEQAITLPGFLSKVVPMQLAINGEYTFRDDNKNKIQYVLVD